MRRPIAGYHVLVRGDTPVNTAGIAYDYALAGNGIFVSARNAHLAATVHVADARIRGLLDTHAGLELVHGRIGRATWAEIAAACAAVPDREMLCEVVWAGEGGYRLRLPRQAADATRVLYTRAPDVVFQLHSHHGMPAYFSATDDADEQGLGLYGVVGGLGTERPQVLLRLGIYGHFQVVPWDAVFEGQLDGFTDLAVASSDPEQPSAMLLIERLEERT